MTKLIYLTDNYKKTLNTRIIDIKKQGHHWEVKLSETIFYPQGGGQPSDQGTISGKSGKLIVTHVRLHDKDVIHEGKLEGSLKNRDIVTCEIDWQFRYKNMRLHSAGHIIHDVIMKLIPGLKPLRADHAKQLFIEYQGQINSKLKETIEKQANMLVASDKSMVTEFVLYEDLLKRVKWIPEKLPINKPLRILQIGNNLPTPDGGTQVAKTSEVGEIKITKIVQINDNTRIYYEIKLPNKDVILEQRSESTERGDRIPSELRKNQKNSKTQRDSIAPLSRTLAPLQNDNIPMMLHNFQQLILEQQNEILNVINDAKIEEIERLKLKYFGSHGKSTQLIRKLQELPKLDRKSAGMLVNEFKNTVELAYENQLRNLKADQKSTWFDITQPGIRPPEGHLHIVTQAVTEITSIFEKIGFTRVRYPEVDWDWYPFESLNMPPNHPARDEWETFFIEYPDSKCHSRESGNLKKIPGQARNDKRKKIVLTPHTSNGQVREMEKGRLPIRMINIAKCYRRQVDISHTPMFHQFEGMYIDTNVSITHLKGVFDYFVKQFYGSNRTIRLRPFHFQFTEPSFEVDINCGICLGKGVLSNGQKCKLCKSGWLEMAGSGMIHPVVLRNGGINPDVYSGFAFGWGVERAYMMKNEIQIDDIRLIYSNDLRFLEQF